MRHNGLLERETKILSKAAALFSDEKWSLGEPPVGMVDEATDHVDFIDELAWNASTLLRMQIMRSKSGAIKVVPFQPLKRYFRWSVCQDSFSFQAFCTKLLPKVYNHSSVPYIACDSGEGDGGRRLLVVADCEAELRGIEQQFTVRKPIKIQINNQLS
jgi:hypothetical protein